MKRNNIINVSNEKALRRAIKKKIRKDRMIIFKCRIGMVYSRIWVKYHKWRYSVATKKLQKINQRLLELSEMKEEISKSERE